MGSHHHYVPQLYLRLFGLTRGGKQVRQFIIEKERYVASSSIKNQCQKKYFYGKTQLMEETLSNIESVAGAILQEIVAEQSLPQKTSKERNVLLFFLALQAQRTKYAVEYRQDHYDEFNAMKRGFQIYAKGMGAIFSEEGECSEDLFDPVVESLKCTWPIVKCIQDLKARLLLAPANSEFITSDHPIQLYNSYCQKSKTGGETGYASTGLQIFYPISPRQCLLLFDRDIYKVGRPNSSKPIPICKSDVDDINALQYVGADENLYFSGDLGEAYFRKLKVGRKKARELSRVARNDQVLSKYSVLRKNVTVMPSMRLNLTFMSIRRDTRRLVLRDRPKYKRRGTERLYQRVS